MPCPRPHRRSKKVDDFQGSLITGEGSLNMKWITVSALITAMCLVASAQSNSGVQDEVLAAQKRFYEAYRDCDHESMEQLVTEDLLYGFSVGFVHKGKAEFIESLKPEGCGWDELTVEVKDVRIYGDTAVLLGDFHYDPKGDTPRLELPLTAMQVFVKQNGRWLFAANQTSEAVPMGASVQPAD